MDYPKHQSRILRILRGSVLFVIRCYQRLLSPLFGNNCRFYPCCSNYAIDAIEQHGCMRGGILVMRRLVRCNPLVSGGFDPVPEIKTQTQKQN